MRKMPWRAPKCSSAAATMASLVSSVVTSPATATTPSTVFVQARASALRSAAITEAPSATSRSTVARPMPDAPPVTAYTRPALLLVMVADPMVSSGAVLTGDGFRPGMNRSGRSGVFVW